MKALNRDEILKVLKIAAKNKRNHAMILLAFKHGMRASEICGLKVTDIDLKNREITIRRLKGSLKTTQPLQDVPGQPLLSENKVLRAYLAARGDQSNAGYVFTTQKSGRMHRSAFYRVFSAIAAEARLPEDKRHPHCLKHSLGFFLVEENVNLAMIRQALGHKSLASTAVYTEPTDESAGKAVAAAFSSAF